MQGSNVYKLRWMIARLKITFDFWKSINSMYFNMVNIIEETILSIILIFEMKHQTEIKLYHMYQDIWSPELGENLEFQCEPENPIGKYDVCVKTTEN